MALKQYGVLKGRPVERRLGTGNRPHYQIRVIAKTETFRIAVNVKSSQQPSELLYYVNDHFEHPVTDRVQALEHGFHPLAPAPTSGALDFIRGNLFKPEQMIPLPANKPGPDNDLNEKFDAIVQRALGDESAMIYAFGEPWGPENGEADNYFGFTPGRGIHDIHMNQGNSGEFKRDNGVWQDGGLLLHFPEQAQWVAVFTAFQSQAWHTHDSTGDPLPREGGEQPGVDVEGLIPTTGHLPTVDLPDGLIRIVGALVNPPTSPEVEVVTLLNTSPAAIALAGWMIADKQKARMTLSGSIAAGGVMQVTIQPPVALSNQGGLITLLDPSGRKVDGVSYTKAQAQQVGWTLTF